jgi:TRAP-type C4-dicarboxylate transport system permease small subunit
VLCYLLLVAVTVITGMAVVARYIINNPIAWTEEVARYILIWLTMLGASVAMKRREHISLDSVVRRLPRRAATVVEMVMFTIIIVLLILVDKHSITMVVTQSVRRFSPSVGISMVWPQTSLPVGFTLIVIQSLYIILEDLRELLTGTVPEAGLGVPEIE